MARHSPAMEDADFTRVYSREDYQRWYDAQPRGRHEHWEGHIVSMAPERGAHLRMKAALYMALRRAVLAAGVPCQALPDGATVQTGDNDYEPDAMVNCGPPMPDDAVAAPNPVVVAEVLSPGTTKNDTGGKLVGYFQVPSIAHYLIAHPLQRAVIHHRRTLDGIATHIVRDGPVVMEPPGITITLEEVYEAAAL